MKNHPRNSRNVYLISTWILWSYWQLLQVCEHFASGSPRLHLQFSCSFSRFPCAPLSLFLASVRVPQFSWLDSDSPTPRLWKVCKVAMLNNILDRRFVTAVLSLTFLDHISPYLTWLTASVLRYNDTELNIVYSVACIFASLIHKRIAVPPID